jgi:hypothetical protein
VVGSKCGAEAPQRPGNVRGDASAVKPTGAARAAAAPAFSLL